MKKQQSNFLDSSASQYHNKIIKDWEKLYLKKWKFLYSKMRQTTHGNSVLEMGCADGIMTQWLVRDYSDVTVVDGSDVFLQHVSSRIQAPNLHFDCALFEEYIPNRQYDIIMITHILEHLDDPVNVLRRIKDWISPDGQVFVAVPNANSIHRLIGTKMGLLKSPNSLNDQDHLLGHKRVYTPKLFRSHIHEAGFEIEKFGGCMIKPLSNRQIEADWSDELIEAFFALGDDFPELCSEIFAVLKLSQ
jgi:2-polyprenyl-3-methyl-5-hydroxy-6-metoxy-1,4-benzoquinol methylase